MIKKFYCFRHGETDYNTEHRIQGSTIDISLNENGRKQASLIPHIPLEIIFSSPLKRCLETAEIYSSESDIPIKIKEALKEIDFGDWVNLSWYDLKNKYQEDFLRYMKFANKDWDFRPGNGESKREVGLRIKKCLEEIAFSTKEENIGIFSHGGVLYLFVNFMFSDENSRIIPALRNSEYLKISYNTETFEFKLENK